MKLSVCTISFRHHLVGLSDIARFAHSQEANGIELWGVHALNEMEQGKEHVSEIIAYMRLHHLAIPLISDYLDINGPMLKASTVTRCFRLLEAAHLFGVPYIRTFAGQLPSASVEREERRRMVSQLRLLADECGRYGKGLLVETHPNTLADSLSSTIELMEEVNHEGIGVNLDFLHIWEAGTDPVVADRALKQWTRHYHLKNIHSRSQLRIFDPHNVYASSGNREGMVALRNGEIRYDYILKEIQHADHFASLEWFGDSPYKVLSEDLAWTRNQLHAYPCLPT
ncbi:sugar phosphate isomerase/epimerase [Paenibacillus sp. ACRRX]|uniref:sugar phosphate isomerase/epimerase family protein n=1 Tax=Paenibacillus sp. ACRRX TaxID=2918206 RepID=UPI001EF5B267|nr:sugar phosphate isomerase/epimerase family protein [Paenibacillus sp. ACRRX]MCG7407362.1 sugar phosphate isomerase/epimerase [Paenibacillus sp. ACRRX]